MTTRARAGRSGCSVVMLDVLERLAEAGFGEAAGGALEALHRPAPEVEVDRAGAVLDRAPQGPAVHADQAEQLGPGDPAAARLAVVGRDQRGQGVVVQVRLGGDVAELEAGVVVAGQVVAYHEAEVPVV